MPKKSDNEFPGFARCMAMMRKRKVMTAESGYFWLLWRANEFVEPLLAELQTEEDEGVQCYILELLGAAHDLRALPVFIQYMFSPTEWLHIWAEHGLRDLRQTSEGRSALWRLYWRQASSPVPLTSDEEQRLHETLERILHEPACGSGKDCHQP